MARSTIQLKEPWAQFLFDALATRVAVALVPLPALAIALRLFLALQDRAALSDQEILQFVLSPIGLPCFQ
jgi:hypothetical protein